MKLVRGVPLLLERHVHVRGYVSVPLYKHKTNSMVQTIATLIDETLMVMGGQRIFLVGKLSFKRIA